MVDKEQILRLTNGGLDVFSYYLGIPVNVHRNFKSPFYEDKHASCHIYFDKRTSSYKFYDHGDTTYSGDCFWFVSTLNHMNIKTDFPLVLKKIVEDLGLSSTSCRIVPQCHSNLKEKQNPPLCSQSEDDYHPFRYDTKPFDSGTLAYWQHYGISKEILNKYNVKNLSLYESISSEGRPFVIQSSSTEPLFAYIREEYIKLYRPNSTKLRFLYGGKKPENYCFGMEHIPCKGDVLFITGGEKDVLTLVSHGFNAVCFNSETAVIPKSVIENLHLRFRHIILLYDVDETGLRESQKQSDLLSEYNVLNLRLPLSGTKSDKDVSDYFAHGNSSQDLETLVENLLRKLYAQTVMMLRSCEIDYENPPNISKSVVAVNDVPLGVQDNLFCITGGEGTGKSNYVSAIVSGAISCIKLSSSVTLGVEVAPNPQHFAVLLFDTEQSESQLYKNMGKTLRRASSEKSPFFFHAFYLAALSRQDRLKLIRESMDLFHHKHGGIHLVVIDGIADLIRSANDETESIAIVDELYRLAGIYNTCIICVLHFVPNGIKLRGHIGSELQRKAAGILSIEKDDNSDNSVVKAIKVRDGSPLDVPMMLFGWDKEADMHVYRGEKSKEDKEKRKIDELANVIREVFKLHDRLTYQELCDILMREMDIKDRTAKKYISYMKEQRILSQDASGNYKKGELCR